MGGQTFLQSLNLFFNSVGLFAQQNEEANQLSCERDYHAVERMDKGFSAIEQWRCQKLAGVSSCSHLVCNNNAESQTREPP